ncbi:hypothetical protein RVR_6440 [Actinacidiphila reveromycinica]|uniref:Secreted protein n=1 Tax=Actinacidiphila reveromycinica TaxID=659352 RepID=A0A7U3UVM9_9ACTN|nr:hypothetical protein [Streptomyces sp. SN-593]BBA99707.1 hypothetical protein RVR_6440 [Streptomyces sp. SN-593]
MPSLRTALALTLTAAAAAVALPAAAAVAADAPAGLPDIQGATDALPTSGITSMLPTQSVTGALGAGIAPVRDLKLDPLNNTTVDPLTNGVGSQIADFRPISTTDATAPLTDGGSLGTLPLIGPLTGVLPH